MSLTVTDRQIGPDSSDTSQGMIATIPLQPSQSSVLGLDPIHSTSFLDPDPVLKLHVCQCKTSPVNLIFPFFSREKIANILTVYEITIAKNNTKTKCDFTFSKCGIPIQ
jgi:hypothetical protein